MMSYHEDENYLAYVTQLREEHRHLRDCLDRVQQEWDQCRGKRDVGELLGSLKHLRAVLAQHCAEGEAGGCIEEAAIHSPRLSRETTQLQQEGPCLLEDLDGIIKKLETSLKTTGKVAGEYQALVKRIHAHTAAENRVMEESFRMESD